MVKVFSKIKKNAWLLTLLLAILSLFVVSYNIIVLVPRRTSKALDIVLISNYSLIDLNNKNLNGSDIQLLYKGKPTQNLSIIEFSVENSGMQPIPKTDYETPLQFLTAPNSSIIDVIIVEKRPYDLDIQLTVTSCNVVEQEPALMNPGDKYIARLVVMNDSSNGGLFSPKGRITGIQEITSHRLIEISITDKVLPRINIGHFSFEAEAYTLLVGIVAGLLALLLSNLMFHIFWGRRSPRS